MKNDITKDMQLAIGHAHSKAEIATTSARAGIDAAITSRRACAAMVHKHSRFHKQDLCGSLAEQLNASEVKQYLSIHQAATKRPDAHDKRQLLLCGIIDQQDSTSDTSSTASKPSFISRIAKMGGSISKAVSKRPVDMWGQSECDQALSVMGPVIELYEQIKARAGVQ